MPLSVDMTFDVAVDADLAQGHPQTFGTPPEIEGDFAGVLFFGEAGSEDPIVEYVPIPGPPGADGVFNGDAFDLALGMDLATDDTDSWVGGAIPLAGTDSVAYAIAKINKKLATAASQADVLELQAEIAQLVLLATDMPLGEDVGTDDASLWDGGAVALNAGLSVAYALSRLNHKVGDVLQTLADGVGAQHGFELPLGDVVAEGDGSWTPGAVPLTNLMPVSEAMDRLNEVMAKLLPSSPPDFPNGTLTLANGAGSSPLLCAGVTDNSGSSIYAAGGAVNRITAAGFSSNTFNDVGPGDSGKVAVLVNGVEAASRVLAGAGDNGSYSGLVIADQKDYPAATPGFWKSIDVSVNLVAVPVGINKVRLSHSAAGQTGDVYFVRDTLTGTPAVSNGTLMEFMPGVVAYSSGVPHYDQGAVLTARCEISNLSGETYYGGADALVFSGTNGIITADSYSLAGLGFALPLARNVTAPQAITALNVSIDGANVHASGQVQAAARNVNGASAATSLTTTNVLVKRGSAGSRIDEMSVTVSGLGSAPNTNNAKRKGQGAGDTPIGAGVAWVQANPLAVHEAAVVGGVLKHDKTNYAAGFLPVGPDYSVGRDGAQYVTFSFNRAARSSFKITVAGAYSGCRIKLPGVSDNQPNAPNGWWDAFKPYDGAGVPGEAGDTAAGCALGTVMSGGSGTFTITFGTESSTNATGNEILVRFKLALGQSITALSFTN